MGLCLCRRSLTADVVFITAPPQDNTGVRSACGTLLGGGTTSTPPPPHIYPVAMAHILWDRNKLYVASLLSDKEGAGQNPE